MVRDFTAILGDKKSKFYDFLAQRTPLRNSRKLGNNYTLMNFVSPFRTLTNLEWKMFDLYFNVVVLMYFLFLLFKIISLLHQEGLNEIVVLARLIW